MKILLHLFHAVLILAATAGVLVLLLPGRWRQRRSRRAARSLRAAAVSGTVLAQAQARAAAELAAAEPSPVLDQHHRGG